MIDKLLLIAIHALFLTNTWWCIFVSQALPSQRFVWWVVSTFIWIWLMGMLLIDKKDNKNEDE